MRPTFSIIFFTLASGAGYGLWFLMGLDLMVGPTCGARGAADASGVTLQLCMNALADPYALYVGFVLVTAGLLSSLGHLGKPLRAWRALSQWRSSWLSREGVAALLTYVPIVIVAAYPLLPSSSSMDGALRAAGAAIASGAFATVYCTAHIYSSLKPVRAWHNRYVTPAYLLFALYSGLLWLWALSTLPYGQMRASVATAMLAALALVGGVCAALKIAYWRDIDAPPAPLAGSATGLDAIGAVRPFEAPHTEENYLTHEMGFVLARAHSRKLRMIALLCAFCVPILLAASALLLPAAGRVLAWPALAFGVLGLIVERWLFFAEARHAVIAYYGR
ncbi:MAG TPA: DmsC/YnfH family molybdoenzyme membrane anchor subunit [Rhodanobacteraceae bacterium]|nr:DmsC/YnfH family molybdoenzyme membrane anchor subunit [Rhodanobacteraceae bacterium]